MKKNKIHVGLAIAIVIAVFLFFLFIGKVSVKFSDNDITVGGTTAGSVTIKFSDIKSVQCVDSFNFGTREFGVRTPNLLLGTFKNNEFGKYKLFVFQNTKKYIVVKYNDDELVFNQKTIEETEKIYNEIKEKVNK